MTGSKPQRGPLLSSVLMVMLATAATGLLAMIGLQALPESVVPSTFGGDDHEVRTVDVSESPSATAPPRKKTAPPSATATTATTAEPGRTTRVRVPNGVRTASSVATTEPARPAATTAPPKRTTSPSATASKPPTAGPTQTPSPSPSCDTGRKPRCPKSPGPRGTSTATFSPSSAYSGYEAPTYSETKAKKQHKPAKRHKSRKR